MPILRKAARDEFDSPVERLLASVTNLVQQPKSKGAHFYRTSLRRFQAWSDVFHPKMDSRQKQALKFLDKVRRTTGKLRDAEVHFELVEKLSAGSPAEKKRLESELKSRRNSYQEKLKDQLRHPMVAGLWRSLRVLDEAPAASEPATFHEMSGMTTLAIDEYRAFVKRHGPISPQNLHEYRLECKRFRYTAELAGDTPEVNDLVETWKGVQDVIGEWHDYLTLSEVAEDILGDSQILASLQASTKKKYAESLDAVQKAEQKLTSESIPKKRPRKASSARRARAA
jgi:CHAD domain-containing protein